MVLSINIPEDVKLIFNNMKQLNKNRILSNLSNERNIQPKNRKKYIKKP